MHIYAAWLAGIAGAALLLIGLTAWDGRICECGHANRHHTDDTCRICQTRYMQRLYELRNATEAIESSNNEIAAWINDGYQNVRRYNVTPMRAAWQTDQTTQP